MKPLVILTILTLTSCVNPGAGYNHVQPVNAQLELSWKCKKI